MTDASVEKLLERMRKTASGEMVAFDKHHVQQVLDAELVSLRSAVAQAERTNADWLRDITEKIEQRKLVETECEKFKAIAEAAVQQVKDITNMHWALFQEPLAAWAQQQPEGEGIDDGGTVLDWGPLIQRIIREHGERGTSR